MGDYPISNVGVFPKLDRRRFLKLSASAGVMLSTTSLVAAPFVDAVAAPKLTSDALVYLTSDDVVIIGALIPVVLAGALPDGFGRQDMEGMIRRIDASLDRLAPYTKAELRLLFDLIAIAPVRALLGRVWSPWEVAEKDDLDRFLDRWSDSSIPQLRSAYFALHEMITFAWYGDPAAWGRVGYPGPPDVERPKGELPA